jgi:hypothetical protein
MFRKLTIIIINRETRVCLFVSEPFSWIIFKKEMSRPDTIESRKAEAGSPQEAAVYPATLPDACAPQNQGKTFTTPIAKVVF